MLKRVHDISHRVFGQLVKVIGPNAVSYEFGSRQTLLLRVCLSCPVIVRVDAWIVVDQTLV